MLESAGEPSRMGQAQRIRPTGLACASRPDPEWEMPPMPPVFPLVRSLPLVGFVIFAMTCQSASRGGEAQGGALPRAVFTASDFPALAEGIDLKTSGELSVHAWAPAN